MEAAESVLRAGYRLDRYELLCPIASGGMATVWLARLRGKRGFEKLFAIKTIRTELVDDPRFQEMLLDEARIASGIQHPNVAQILDLGEQQDVLFIVMEWVDGDSLAKVRKLVAKRGHRLPVGVVLRILADACAGLHAAHELRDAQGEALEIVHRDVSPQNILLGTSGAVKIIDFGIAKAHGRKQGETRTGVVKGKIQYMAPEQVKKGREADRRADVWALGVCLHELVSGKLPYDGDDDVEVIRKLMTDEVPPMAEGIPEAIVRVLERSVALDADARFPTAAGMQRALEAAMKELGEAATTEDVAAFLRSELPELAQKRRDVVNKAIEDSRDRSVPSGETKMHEPDVAFAPTVVSDATPALSQREPRADRPSDVGTVALVKKKPSGAEAPSPLLVGGSDALDLEPIEIPKKSKAWLWIMLVLLVGGGVAAYRYPNEARRTLAAIGIGGGTSDDGLHAVAVPMDPSVPSVAPSAHATASVSTSPPGAPAAPATTVADAPGAGAASAAGPLPSGSASMPSASASAVRPEPGSSHHTWPHEPPAAVSAPVHGEPAASAPPIATAPWSPYKKTPAAGSDNPYEGSPAP
jgi:eukaryotic-like serine/threonine-protein kinase